MTKRIDFGPLKIPVTEYASQGNAILGIRDSGKSYTATYLAERLLESGVPFVAFDPIGIWKYLRVAGKSKGYPVVVAGGRHGDLPLTPHSAPEIVRAAMRENLPLVLDLYSIQLSKADWKKIVEQSIRLLLYENGEHGLRHIFIEEAAEFAPQRVGPDQGQVYAEIEKLARMGGNARLGYTLINQRAEEVNKAVLELCDCLFLHRQKGRNSLTALSKWLDIGDVADARPIIKSLPTLPQGECWVWPSGSVSPVRINVPQKNTFHPDRRALTQSGAGVTGKAWDALDVSAFVRQMSGTLEKALAESKANDPAELKRQIAALKRELTQAQAAQPKPEIQRIEVPILFPADFARLESAISSLREQGRELFGAANQLEIALKLPRPLSAPTSSTKPALPFKQVPRTGLVPTPTGVEIIPNGARRMLQCLAQRHPLKLTRSQLGTLAGFTPSGGTFGNYFGLLKRLGYLVEAVNGDVAIMPDGLNYVGSDVPPAPTTTAEMLTLWRERLPAGAARMLDLLADIYPRSLSRQSLGEQSGFTASGGTFGNYLGLLRRNGLVDIDRDQVRASAIFFFGQ